MRAEPRISVCPLMMNPSFKLGHHDISDRIQIFHQALVVFRSLFRKKLRRIRRGMFSRSHS